MRAAKRLRAHAKGAVVRVRRPLGALARVFQGTFPGFKNVVGLPLEGISGSLTTIPLDERVVHMFDFLPDRLTLTGDPIANTPFARFVDAYLTKAQFDYRTTDYYRRAAAGTLALPSAGVPAAEWRCRNFSYVIKSIENEGYQPARYGAISVVECADGSWAVINGRHRAATLLVMGQKECEAVVWSANEADVLFGDHVHRLWPQRFYRKQFDALRELGKPLSIRKAQAEALARRIRAARLEMWNDVYHPIPFHEFRDLRPMLAPTVSYRRLAMILSRGNAWSGKRVLDLGCNLGFYSFSLARRGAVTLGIDLKPEYIEFAADLAALYESPARFCNAPITPELIESQAGEFDVTLCFSVLQWIIEQHGDEFGGRVLQAISAKSKALFFDVAVNSGKAQLRCRAGDEIAFTYDLLRRYTSYPTIEYVGDVEPFGVPRHVFYCSR